MVSEEDLVVTADIPLADRVITKKAYVIDHRGGILNENNIKEFYLDFVREQAPSAKMKDIYSKSHSWGWEVGVTYFYDLDLGFGQSIPYVGIDKAFFFKDREKYTFYYGAPEVYFDEYKPVYEHAVDTLIIKSVTVPEFGSIVMLILVTSIIGVIISARKFQILK